MHDLPFDLSKQTPAQRAVLEVYERMLPNISEKIPPRFIKGDSPFPDCARRVVQSRGCTLSWGVLGWKDPEGPCASIGLHFDDTSAVFLEFDQSGWTYNLEPRNAQADADLPVMKMVMKHHLPTFPERHVDRERVPAILRSLRLFTLASLLPIGNKA